MTGFESAVWILTNLEWATFTACAFLRSLVRSDSNTFEGYCKATLFSSISRVRSSALVSVFARATTCVVASGSLVAVAAGSTVYRSSSFDLANSTNASCAIASST